MSLLKLLDTAEKNSQHLDDIKSYVLSRISILETHVDEYAKLMPESRKHTGDTARIDELQRLIDMMERK